MNLKYLTNKEKKVSKSKRQTIDGAEVVAAVLLAMLFAVLFLMVVSQ